MKYLQGLFILFLAVLIMIGGAGVYWHLKFLVATPQHLFGLLFYLILLSGSVLAFWKALTNTNKGN